MNAPVNDMEVFMGASCFGKIQVLQKDSKGEIRTCGFCLLLQKSLVKSSPSFHSLMV